MNLLILNFSNVKLFKIVFKTKIFILKRKPLISRFANITKVDVKNLDEDSYMCTMRQIVLTNCNKCVYYKLN